MLKDCNSEVEMHAQRIVLNHNSTHTVYLTISNLYIYEKECTLHILIKEFCIFSLCFLDELVWASILTCLTHCVLKFAFSWKVLPSIYWTTCRCQWSMDIKLFTFLKAYYLVYPHLDTEIPLLEVVNPRVEIDFPQMFKLTMKPISFFGNVKFCFWISG